MRDSVNNIFKGKYSRLYIEFIDRYADNLHDYILDHCRFLPTFQQIDVVKAIQVPGSRVAVASGHGTGKSFVSAWAIDWALRTQPGSNTLLTATNINQAKSSIWKYLDNVIADVERVNPWMRGVFVKHSNKYYNVFYKDSHWAIPKTASKDRPEGLAGMHADDFLIIADEASGIPDENFSVMRGALTQVRNRMLMISQPTRPVGHFAEAMTTLAKKEMPDGTIVGIYDTFTLNSEESPLVSREFIKEKLQDFGIR